MFRQPWVVSRIIFSSCIVFTILLPILVCAYAPSSSNSPKTIHRCRHDELASTLSPAKRVDQGFDDGGIHPSSDMRRNAKRITNWQPLRITVAFDNLYHDPYTCYTANTEVPLTSGGSYICTASDIMDSVKIDYLNRTMIQPAILRLQELLDIDRLGAITVSDNYRTGCSNVSMPLRFRPTYNTDFILLVTTRPIPSHDVLAYSVNCQSAKSGRPIVGWANFDPSSLVPGNIDTQRMFQLVAAHETSHALGFNYAIFLRQGMITKDATSNNYRMTSPSIVSYVQKHFGCDIAQGALLENDGGAGTASSHWEKAAFMNEYMTSMPSNDPIISPLTLLAFEATGWYRAHLERSDPLVFGREGGCGMITDWTGCTQWPASYTCRTGALRRSKCSASLTGYGPCISEPTHGSLIGPGCRYYSTETYCISPFAPDSTQSQPRAASLIASSQKSGQSFDTDARCFDSTLNKITTLSDLLPTGTVTSSPKCHRVYCSDVDEPRLDVGDLWYPCLHAGNKIPATGYGGAVVCPADAYLDLCQNRVRDVDWPRIQLVNPTKAKPSEPVTVLYTGAFNDSGVVIEIETECTVNNVTAGNITSVTGHLADWSYWGSPRYLNGFNTRLNVILKDSQGRSDVFYRVFQADINFGRDYLKAFWLWLKKRPLYIFLLCVILLLPILGVVLCCCCYRKRWCCCRQQKEEDQQDKADDIEMDDLSKRALSLLPSTGGVKRTHRP